jgi:tetratricopeptide (TPR) repeat protein
MDTVESHPTEAANPKPAAASPASWLDNLPIYAALLFVFLLGCSQMQATDIWWHLRGAQLILAKHTLPETDWFAYSRGAHWININWLWEIIILGIWRFSGVPGIIVSTAVAGVMTFWMLLMREHRGNVPSTAAAAIALVPIMLFAQRYQTRPESLAAFFLSAVLVICRLAARRPRLLWLLPLVQIFWVNTHASFPLEIVVIGCFAAEAMILAAVNGGKTNLSEVDLRVWIAVLAACLAAWLANPYGFKIFSYALVINSRIAGGATARFYQELAKELLGFSQLIKIYGRNGWCNVYAGFMAGTTLLTIAAFSLLLWRRKTIRIAWLLLAILFTCLGWQSLKNLPLFAVAALAVMIWNLDDCGKLEFHLPAKVRKALPLLMTSFCLLLSLSVCTDAYDSVFTPWKKFGFTEYPHISPHAEAEFLARANMPKHIFAYSHSVAAACIFHDGPTRKVYVDGRLEVCDKESYERYYVIADMLLAHNPLAEQMLLEDVPPDAKDHREMPAVLLGLEWFLGGVDNMISNPRWRPVFCGDTAVVLLYEPDAERLGIPALDRKQLRIQILRRGVEMKPNSAGVRFHLGKALADVNAEEATACFRLALELEPGHSEAHACYAALIATKHPDEAEEHFRIAIRCNRRNVEAFCGYADLLMQKAMFSEAVDVCQQALAIDPTSGLARQKLALAQKKYKPKKK